MKKKPSLKINKKKCRKKNPLEIIFCVFFNLQFYSRVNLKGNLVEKFVLHLFLFSVQSTLKLRKLSQIVNELMNKKLEKTIENSRIEFNSKSNDSDEVCPNFKHFSNKRCEFSFYFQIFLENWKLLLIKLALTRNYII